MMFKKIYIEITNNCNLNCRFCPKNIRNKEFLDKEKFTYLLKALKKYTKYLYFHVMGEPLLHPYINEYINLASKNYQINITTNGYLINKIKDNKNIRQINISLHSFDIKYNKSIEEYLQNIVEICNGLNKNNTIINYRLWVNSPYQQEIVNFLNEYYQVNIDLKHSFKIKENIFIEKDEEFEWPNLNNNIYKENGSCYGLKSHLGILVDGTVIPCCLDCNGIIKLGNIYKQSLEEILKSSRVKNIIQGFNNNQRLEELCKHCDFIKK